MCATLVCKSILLIMSRSWAQASLSNDIWLNVNLNPGRITPCIAVELTGAQENDCLEANKLRLAKAEFEQWSVDGEGNAP